MSDLVSPILTAVIVGGSIIFGYGFLQKQVKTNSDDVKRVTKELTTMRGTCADRLASYNDVLTELKVGQGRTEQKVEGLHEKIDMVADLIKNGGSR